MSIRANAGQLRHRITLQEKVTTRSGTGGTTSTWQDIGSIPNVWARKRDASGSQFFEAQESQSEVTTEFVIRHRTDITKGMRVLHGSVPYDIEHTIEDDTAKVWLALMCSRGVTDGG